MTIERKPVSSSLIKSVGHDPETSTLAVEFNSGSVYHYENVSAEMHAAMVGAKSIGAYFVTHIKPNKELFPFTKQEVPDAGKK